MITALHGGNGRFVCVLRYLVPARTLARCSRTTRRRSSRRSACLSSTGTSTRACPTTATSGGRPPSASPSSSRGARGSWTSRSQGTSGGEKCDFPLFCPQRKGFPEFPETLESKMDDVLDSLFPSAAPCVRLMRHAGPPCVPRSESNNIGVPPCRSLTHPDGGCAVVDVTLDSHTCTRPAAVLLLASGT